MTCDHRDIYRKDDNFYCGICHKGMGNAYYKLATTGMELASAAHQAMKRCPALNAAIRHRVIRAADAMDQQISRTDTTNENG